MLLLGGGWQERPHIGTGMLALAISLCSLQRHHLQRGSNG